MIQSADDNTFHYPPELFNLLVDAVPVLNRSKADVLMFFRGAGVADDMLSDLFERLKTQPDDIKKYEIARTVLERLNKNGEASLRERREVLRRVVDFTNFDTCWNNDRMKAKGLVSSIRDVINQKDAFTRMNLEREKERRQRLAENARIARAKQARMSQIEAAKKEFYTLFGSADSAQTRGKKLETALNHLFHSYGILVHEAFHLVGNDGEGIVEQIDGVIGLKGHIYFVEMKWLNVPVGKSEISEHVVRLMARAEGRGIFISASGYTEPAIHTAREFLQQKILALVAFDEIVLLLERQDDLADFLEKKVQSAQIHKNPFFKILDTVSGASV